MRNPHGYIRMVGAGQAEFDTVQCSHCDAHYQVMAFQDPTNAGGWCWNCSAHICLACSKLGRCLPFEKQMEQEEARYATRVSLGMA